MYFTTACSCVLIERRLRLLRRGGLPGPYYAARMRGAFGATRALRAVCTWPATSRVCDSERGLEWRCSDSLSLREFLLLEMRERVPDHSWLSRTRARLPHEVQHGGVGDWVLALIAEAGLVPGQSASGWMPRPWRPTRRCATSLLRDTGEGYRGMLGALGPGERYRDTDG